MKILETPNPEACHDSNDTQPNRDVPSTITPGIIVNYQGIKCTQPPTQQSYEEQGWQHDQGNFTGSSCKRQPRLR